MVIFSENFAFHYVRSYEHVSLVNTQWSLYATQTDGLKGQVRCSQRAFKGGEDNLLEFVLDSAVLVFRSLQCGQQFRNMCVDVGISCKAITIVQEKF